MYFLSIAFVKNRENDHGQECTGKSKERKPGAMNQTYSLEREVCDPLSRLPQITRLLQEIRNVLPRAVIPDLRLKSWIHRQSDRS